ncbi:unnamed protein product [Lampetra fluviatilis]
MVPMGGRTKRREANFLPNHYPARVPGGEQAENVASPLEGDPRLNRAGHVASSVIPRGARARAVREPSSRSEVPAAINAEPRRMTLNLALGGSGFNTHPVVAEWTARPLGA